jgi:hypothetical protein
MMSPRRKSSVDDAQVTAAVDVALGVMGLRVVEEVREPIVNIWQETGGACLSHPGFRSRCPVEWCRYHVCSGMRKTAFDKTDPGHDTCVLRLSQTSHTLEEVGQAFGITRERIRQMEVAALSKIGAALSRIGLSSSYRGGGMST